MRLDLKYALRQIAKNPGFTAVVVLSLAFGIGANTAIFGLVDTLILRPLPVTHPSALVLFQWLPGHHGSRPLSGLEGQMGDDDTDPETGEITHRPFSLRSFASFRADQSAFADIFAVDGLPKVTVTIDHIAETVDFAQLVSGNYYQALGVPAMLGRTLQPADDRAGADGAVVLSYRYWHRRFADNPGVIGQTILVNQVPVTIVGITPPDFAGTLLSGPPTDLTLPLAVAGLVRSDGAGIAKPGNWWLDIMGRLKPGVTVAQAQGALEARFQDSIQGGVSNPNDPPRLRLTPGGSGRTEADRKHSALILAPLMGMVVLVLLTACANTANLLLARGAARRHELAIRLALGASRARLIRQLLTESILLALGGAALGLVVSRWGLALLTNLLPPVDQYLFALPVVDLRVLGFTVGASLVTGIGFGLAPALRATRLDLTAEFQSGSRNLGRGARSRLSQTLLIGQVALAVVLLIAAGLFARTEQTLGAVELGFNRDHLLFFSVNGTPAGYTKTQWDALEKDLAARIGALPGIRAVTFSSWPLISGYGWASNDFSVPGAPVAAGRPDQVTWNAVGADFFSTYEIPVVLGRSLLPADTAAAPPVAVINQTLAEKYFSGENPIGRSINLQGRASNSHGRLEIVGVVRDMKEQDLRSRTPPTAFMPFAQLPRGEANFAVRTAGEPLAMVSALRAAVSAGTRNLPLGNVRTVDEEVRWRLVGERVYASLAVVLGLLALALVCVGLYGLMAYTVLRRTGEIGLRMALGALPGGVLRMILGDSLRLVGFGAALGLAGAAGISRLIASSLYGVSPGDPVTYAAVLLLLIIVATLACLVPARRAANVDPAVTLRAE